MISTASRSTSLKRKSVSATPPCNLISTTNGEEDSHRRTLRRHGDAQAHFPSDDPQTDCRIQVRLLRRSNLADRIPILAPGPGFAGMKKAEVGRVVRVNAG